MTTSKKQKKQPDWAVLQRKSNLFNNYSTIQKPY